MARQLTVSLGQCSEAGRKPANEDFHGAIIPAEPALTLKGVTLAVADGISSSRVSAVASSAAVRTLLEDYYCTSDAWSVKTAAGRVIAAINAWLYAETRRAHDIHERDQGYVCTLSALILKGTAGHIFHLGDGRVCRLAGGSLERLTEDHRIVVSAEQTYLARALGAGPHVEIDYHVTPLEPGDVFVLTTDGVHDHLGPEAIAGAVAARASDLDAAAREIVALALAAGSTDNLTVQIVRVETLPAAGLEEVLAQAGTLAPAPLLEPGARLDGYRVLRTLHDSARSHLYLAARDGSPPVVLKVPSIDLRDDRAYLRRFLMEEWVARRLNHPHVLKAQPNDGPRSALYLVLPYLQGQTLAQWMRDHEAPALETARSIIEQVASGLDAFHRKEMVHGDLRPENVMLDADGTAVIIDFGATRVSGVTELEPADGAPGPLGTAQYSAPETLLGLAPTPQSDIFSLGAVAYHMLTGRLPYGTAPAKLRTAKQVRALRYRPAAEGRPGIPAWVDGALRKALHPTPSQRYQSATEFAHDLRQPNPEFAARFVPLAERDPVVFWKAVSLALALALLLLLARTVGAV